MSGNIVNHLRDRARTGKTKKVRDWRRPPVLVPYNPQQDEQGPPAELTGTQGGWRGKRRRVIRGGNWKDRLHRAAVQGVSGFASAKSFTGRLVKGALGAIRGATRRSNAQAWAGAAANSAAYRLTEPLLGDVAHGIGVGAASLAERGVGHVEKGIERAKNKNRSFWADLSQAARQTGPYRARPDSPQADYEPPTPRAHTPVNLMSRPELHQAVEEKRPLERKPRNWKEGRTAIKGAPGHMISYAKQEGRRFRVQKMPDALAVQQTIAPHSEAAITSAANRLSDTQKWSARRRRAGKNGVFTRGLEMVGLGKRKER